MKRLSKLLILIFLLAFITLPNVYAVEESNTSSSNATTEEATTSSKTKKNDTEFMKVDKYVSCGGSSSDGLIKNIPSIVPRISSSLYNAVMIITPVILIIMGTIDLLRGIMSSKEDEMKKGRESFLKRLIASVVVFLIVVVVKVLVSALAGTGANSTKIVGCINCFISNDCVSS